MADWQQQLLRQAPALSCTDSVRVVCSLAVLHPPSTRLGDPMTSALVNRWERSLLMDCTEQELPHQTGKESYLSKNGDFPLVYSCKRVSLMGRSLHEEAPVAILVQEFFWSPGKVIFTVIESVYFCHVNALELSGNGQEGAIYNI